MWTAAARDYDRRHAYRDNVATLIVDTHEFQTRTWAAWVWEVDKPHTWTPEIVEHLEKMQDEIIAWCRDNSGSLVPDPEGLSCVGIPGGCVSVTLRRERTGGIPPSATALLHKLVEGATGETP